MLVKVGVNIVGFEGIVVDAGFGTATGDGFRTVRGDGLGTVSGDEFGAVEGGGLIVISPKYLFKQNNILSFQESLLFTYLAN